MCDEDMDLTTDPFARRASMTDEELAHLYHLMDTGRDTTLDGKARCESHYKGVDDFGDVVWMRCPEAAKLRVWITREGEPHWGLRCYGCWPHSDQI